MNDSHKNHSRPWYKFPLVWLMISIPATAIVLGITIVSISLNSDTSLVTDDYYKKGKQINLLLERDTNAQRLGLAANLDLASKQRIILTLKPVLADLPDQLKLVFYHPTKSAFDKPVTLKRSPLTGKQAIYLSALPTLINSKWYVQLETNSWRLVGTMKYPDQKNLSLSPAKH